MVQRGGSRRLLPPGMVPGAPRRNVLVLLAYLFALLFVASSLLSAL